METMLSIKIDKKLKDQARKTAQDLGVSLNAVINQHIKRFVATREISFTDHPIPNKRTRKMLDKASADIKAGKNIFGPFETAADMIKSLQSGK